MKFIVSSSKLYAQMQAVSKVIAAKSTLQILENVLFELKDDRLILTASDSETTIRTAIAVEGAEGAGKVAVEGRLMMDTLKEFSEQPLTFTVHDENFAMNIYSQNGTYSFVGRNGNEYPEMLIEDGLEHQFAISASDLETAIVKTIFCTADDELRPVMNGLFFDLNENGLTFVATDAHRLVRYTNRAINGAAAGFILPKKPANVLKGILAKSEDEVRISFNDKNVVFHFGETALACRQIEGRYPNYNAVIPQNNNNIVTVNRQDLINACKRVSVFANTGTSLLRLAIKDNTIKISAQDIDFSTSAEETMACQYEGQTMAIGFKAPFLIEILAAVETEDALLKLSDPARAGLILPVTEDGNEDVTMLLMPMLLND